MTLSRKEAASLLGISLSTLQRRTKAGQYTCIRTGTSQFSETLYTHAGIGLSEPIESQPEPEPLVEHKPVEVLPPKTEPSAVDLKAEADQRFAQDYRSGIATDSNGNRVDGTNEKFPSLGATSLLGPRRPPEPKKPQSGCSHMNPALLSDYVGPLSVSLHNPQEGSGTTQHGEPLAAGLSQEAYDEMMNAWRRNGGGRSIGEQEMAVRRSQAAINRAFPRTDRT